MSKMKSVLQDTAYSIPPKLFRQLCEAVVPKLREGMKELGFEPGVASPSIALTATTKIDGEDARVRIEITLDPDEEPKK
ncbi:hypothetical protein [Hyphomicrobium sp. ghe19]|uniref:hypothetical protein n=1 Tax=Hyphomicrobium sp. ghe19 TaxID=2682968 RepID=UPI001366C453|nr:hypothetical protein HYPP_02430 [Hyphomicrobium sp. ghe19]